jgi:hypothetical protein
MEKRNFLEWFWENRKIVSVTILSGWISTLSLCLYKILPSTWSVDAFNNALKNNDARMFLGLLPSYHALICFILACATARPVFKNPDEPEQDISIAVEASTRIQRRVMYLYLSLTLLYTTYAFFTFIGLPASKQNWGGIFEIVTATWIFFLYVELSELTVVKKGLIVEVVRSGDAQRHRIIFSGLASVLILLSFLSFHYSSENTQFIVRLAAACLSGVTLALVIGRLGSIYINPGALILSLLYLYAVIQPFAAFFDNPIFEFIVTSVALPLKVLLWMVFVWAFTTGKLWEYVQEIRDFLVRQGSDKQRGQVSSGGF